ncbi:MAG: CoxG family protein [Terriglobia bacterium]
MQVNIAENLTLDVTQADVWHLLRDTKRLASMIPGVQSITALEDHQLSGASSLADSELTVDRGADSESYAASVVESIGPFRLKLDLQIRIVEAVEPSRLKAELNGLERGGHNRLSGSLTATLKPLQPEETLLSLTASIEVLGKLAALGAAPIRRRSNEVFAQFRDRLRQELPAKGMISAQAGHTEPGGPIPDESTKML